MPTILGQGGSAYTADGLRNAVRARVGHTSDAILTDPVVDQFLEDARVALNRKVPLYDLNNFDTQIDIQNYSYATANVPTNNLADPLVLYDGGFGGSGCSSIQLFGRFDEPLTLLLNQMLQGQRHHFAEWDVRRVVRSYSFLVHFFSGKGGNLVGDEQIWLDPKPTSVMTVYHITPVPRFAAVDDVDDRYRDAFFSFAESRAAAFMAGKQSELVSVRSDAGKDVATAGGRVFAMQARDAEMRFHRLTSSPGGMARTRQLR